MHHACMGEIPEVFSNVCSNTGLIPKLAQLRLAAQDRVRDVAFDYVDGATQDEITMRENRESWQRFRLRSRVLNHPKKNPDISCTLFGYQMSAPLLIAPMAFHRSMHEEAEVATARAAEKCGIPMCLSMYGTFDLDDLSETGIALPIILQQCYMRDHDAMMKNFLSIVYRAGCRCLVWTVDSPVYGVKDRVQGNRYSWRDIQFAWRKEKYWKGMFETEFERLNYPMRCDWKVISWIKSFVDMKVILKGILHPDDAALAVEHGADGIIVSNHGGRQLDTTVTTMDALPGVVRAVDRRIPVLVDGGIQTGADIIKALAMGASAVLIGRPILYALAVGGAEKVVEVIEDLKRELVDGLTLCGCSTLSEVTSDVLHQHS